MNIARFEPGDMTSYEVLFIRLTPKECREAGVSVGSVLFGFNPRGRTPFSYYHFAVDSGDIHWTYYAEKMGVSADDTWTRNAGLRVFEHLTGRHVLWGREEPDLGWKSDWRGQLEGLDRVVGAVAR